MSSSRPSVGGLFFHGDPSAIAGFIPPIVVDAVNRQPGWRLAHVAEEVFKGLPPFANGDASGAIPWPCSVTRVCATLNKRRPAGIDGCGFPSEIMSVLQVAGHKFFPVSATATGDASPKVADASDCFRAAIADASPHRLVALLSNETKGDEATETLTGDISESGHDGSFDELLCQEAARRFSGGPSRISTIFCGRLQ